MDPATDIAVLYRAFTEALTEVLAKCSRAGTPGPARPGTRRR